MVDDGSTDGRTEILQQLAAHHEEIELIRQQNAGKGAAIRAAIPRIAGEIAVILDADLEYDPAEAPRAEDDRQRACEWWLRAEEDPHPVAADELRT